MHRQRTQLAYAVLVLETRTVFELQPRVPLREAARQLHVSPATLQRAFHNAGTTFEDARRDARLDKAATRLLFDDDRTQTAALHNAARAAGGGAPRHLCGPFRERYGVTPGVVWRAGVDVRALRDLAARSAPHSRRDSAGYARHRRRILKHRGRLLRIQRQLGADTILATAVRDALTAPPQRPATTSRRRRARPRRRGRPRALR